MAKRTPVPAQPAIQSDEEAGREALQYLDLRAQVEQLDTEERDRIAAIKQEIAGRRDPIAAECKLKRARVQTWAESTRAGRKTIKFPNGRVARWRSRKRLVVTGNLRSIVRSLLKRNDWDHFIDVSLRAERVKANPEALKIAGLKVEENEYFSIG